MQRDVASRLRFTAMGPTRITLGIAVASPEAEERLTVTRDGEPVGNIQTVVDHHGTRFHRFWSGAGVFDVDYAARVTGRAAPEAVTAADELLYLRPSRYCESDVLGAQAQSDFGGMSPAETVAAVVASVGERLRYEPGASGPSDGALATLSAGAGVCRDYAHVVVALLRALEVPARVAAVYAPGLTPMDFHAVAEAAVDGQWRVVDATGLAPRHSLLRIATGRDAADVSFLDTSGANICLDEIEVMAVADELPVDEAAQLVSLG